MLYTIKNCVGHQHRSIYFDLKAIPIKACQKINLAKITFHKKINPAFYRKTLIGCLETKKDSLFRNFFLMKVK